MTGGAKWGRLFGKLGGDIPGSKPFLLMPNYKQFT